MGDTRCTTLDSLVRERMAEVGVDVDASVQELGRAEWLAPEGYPSEFVLTAKLGTFEFGTTLVTVMDRALALAFEDDIIAALGRIGGRRWRQGRARRVRMARKRRRGWA